MRSCSLAMAASPAAVPSTTLLQRASSLAVSGRTTATSLAESGRAAVESLVPRVTPALTSAWAMVSRPPVAAALLGLALVVALVRLFGRKGGASAEASKVSTPAWAKPEKASSASTAPSLFRRKPEPEPAADAPNAFFELGAALGGVALEVSSLAASAALSAVATDSEEAPADAEKVEMVKVEMVNVEMVSANVGMLVDEEGEAAVEEAAVEEADAAEVDASEDVDATPKKKSISQAWDELFGFEAKE